MVSQEEDGAIMPILYYVYAHGIICCKLRTLNLNTYMLENVPTYLCIIMNIFFNVISVFNMAYFQLMMTLVLIERLMFLQRKHLVCH